MPSHRAYFATAEQARTAAATAVTSLTAQWIEDAGDDASGSAPTVDVRIEAVGAMPAAPGDDNGSDATVRIVGPDGRREIARIAMPSNQSDVLLTKASGTVLLNRNSSGIEYTQMRAKSRVATSIQITTTAATAILVTHIVQDRITGKKYTCAATAIASAGVQIVTVTETDATDTNDVTHGTVLEFLNPPAEVNPIARVYGMAGFSITFGDELTDDAGRTYVAGETVAQPAAVGLAGDNDVDLRVTRDQAEYGTGDDTALAVGDELTWTATPANARPTVEIVSVVDEGAGTFVEGDEVTAGSSYAYSVTASTSFGDYAAVLVPIVSVERGATYDLGVGGGAEHVPTGSLGTVATAIPASDYPENYASQVIGSAMEWTSRVYRGTDGRWIADVYTLPLGS